MLKTRFNKISLIAPANKQDLFFKEFSFPFSNQLYFMRRANKIMTLFVDYLNNNPFAAYLLIMIFIVPVFWNGLWAGIPRADQIVFFHHITQFDNISEILQKFPSWNRIGVSYPIDYKLYRPLLYLQLSVYYLVFGYNFFAWQVASLISHIFVVYLLYYILTKIIDLSFLYSFLFSIVFGVNVFGSELVLWNHLSSYLLFLLLILISLSYFVIFISSKRSFYYVISLSSAFLAQFFYELGFIFNFIIAISFIVLNFFDKQIDFYKNKKSILLISFPFIISGLIYIIIKFVSRLWSF